MTFKRHTVESAPEGAQNLLEGAQKAFGFIPNLMAIMAESPATLEAYLALNNLFDQSSFSPTERQIVMLAVNHENECHYCMAAHTMLAKMQKVDEGVINALRENQPIADEKLQALRALTTEVVRTRAWPNQDTLKAFYDAGYSQQQVLEIMLGVVTKTLANYVNHITKTPIDEAFSPAVWEKTA